MPDPKNGVQPTALTPSGDLVRFDVATGQVSRFASAKVDATSPVANRVEGHPGVDPIPADGNPRVILGDGVEGLSFTGSGNRTATRR